MADNGARRVMLVFGTRPEAVKMAPVAIALAGEPDLTPIVTVTAQHRGLLDQVLNVFGLVPDFDLNIFQPGQDLAEITARAITSLDRVMADTRPDVVLVQGDTTTTFVGALCAFYHRIPVAHLEAGLRTGQPYSPYPEEINRRLTSQLSIMHLAATAGAKANLVAEGVARDSIIVTGNTVVDALLWVLERPREPLQPALADLDNERGDGAPMLLVTAHRRESWGDQMQSIGRALRDIADARPDVVVVVPLHPNPIIRGSIFPEVAGAPNIRLVEPLSYSQFALMLRRADLVLTDSGGVQEEAPSLHTPVLIMRETTERPEAIAVGAAKLVGTGSAGITEEVLRLLGSDTALQAMMVAENPFGDGRAAARVVAAVRHIVSGGALPPDFG